MTSTVEKPDLRVLAYQERTELAEFLATLTPEQWEARTLCDAWTVRQVVAHMLSFEELDLRGVISRFAQGRFLPGRINDVGVAAYDRRTPDELLTLLTNHLEPRGFTAGFGGMIALLDALIHHQDIRRPLGLPRRIPAERLENALRYSLKAPPVRAFWRARGLRLAATDVDFTTGRGPELRGEGEAILLAIAGRHGIVGELAGPGRHILRRRLGE